MKSLAVLTKSTSLFVNTEEGDNVVSFYKNSVNYVNLPLEEKWKYRKAVNQLQILINKIQSEEITSIEDTQYNLPEVVKLLRIRKEMLLVK
ncbi:MAG TPA: hypothetical protein VD908_21690 [Cytophagales bacterium]|nr:hypothetical protein [Cytophagales bacterium]